jgi:hypothetical protein
LTVWCFDLSPVADHPPTGTLINKASRSSIDASKHAPELRVAHVGKIGRQFTLTIHELFPDQSHPPRVWLLGNDR